MRNTYFQFKQFTIHQHKTAMKVTTDSCLFGAWVASQVSSLPPSSALLDIGMGTGLLSLMVAQQCSGSINGIEIEAAAAEQASENIAASPWQDRVEVIHADMQQWLPQTKYDVIFSNPPFYEDQLQSGRKDRDRAHHSLDFSLISFLDFIQQHLHPAGSFYLLLPFYRQGEVLKLLREKNLFPSKLLVVKQSVLHAPFRLLVAGGTCKEEPVISTISICEADKKTYTAECRVLLQPYYLHL